MKALLIGNRERFEKFDPHTAFSEAVDKVYLDMADMSGGLPAEAMDADFIAADAVASVTGEMISHMPRLKLIHSEGVGYDKIDLETARERGVLVCNNKGVNADSVAEQTVLLMLGLLRKVTAGDNAVRGGRQIEHKERMMLDGFRELSECRVGLVGFGDIAKATALRLSAFGCEVFYSNRCPKSPDEEARYHVRYLPLDELRKACDIISLHIPATPDTAKMVDRDFLRAMKHDALLVNTARGDLVDNDALCEALRAGWISGAGLDTVAPEPVPVDHPLLHLPEQAREKLLFSPHIGGVSSGVFKRAHRNIWRAFEAAANGETPPNVVR